MKPQYGYPKRVDAHIYGPSSMERCQDLNDWIELAAAAMDQAGFSVKSQDEIRKRLVEIAAAEHIKGC